MSRMAGVFLVNVWVDDILKDLAFYCLHFKINIYGKKAKNSKFVFKGCNIFIWYAPLTK